MSAASSWSALEAACDRLADEYDPGRVYVSKRVRGLSQVPGIYAPQFAVFEPVMRRKLFTRTWEQVVPVEDAAGRAEAVLREGT